MRQSLNHKVRRISGGAADVLIRDDLVIKTYKFAHDSLHETTDYAYLTTELCILNLLNGIDGFPHIMEIIQDPPKYGIVMPYLGEPDRHTTRSLRLISP